MVLANGVDNDELFSLQIGAKNPKGKKGASSGDSIQPVDAETQARLEALLEAAGIGKLSGETKQLTDPDVSMGGAAASDRVTLISCSRHSS